MTGQKNMCQFLFPLQSIQITKYFHMANDIFFRISINFGSSKGQEIF